MKKKIPTSPKAAKLHRQAEALLSQKKVTALPATEADTLRLVHELQVHQIELEIQNEELVRAQGDLETLLRQYTDLYDFAPGGVFHPGAPCGPVK
ncbi:MAG: hypothetical protein HY867_15525 [Chloroflexi bacterium]|nr:hypothetical protein [Chloroflexota bacterium]